MTTRTTSTARSDAPAPRDAAEKRLLEYADREQRALDGWHALGATPKSTTLHTERITLARDAAAEIAALRARVEVAEVDAAKWRACEVPNGSEDAQRERAQFTHILTKLLTAERRAEAVERALAEIAEIRVTHTSVSGPSLREQVTLYQSAWWTAMTIARAALAAARATPAQDTPTTEG